jgi:ribosomal protein L11 methyltransferase
MQWIEARVVFESSDSETAISLISDIFYDFSLQGVVVETPDVDPGVDWAENDFTRPSDHAVIGYFPKNDQLTDRCRILEARLRNLNQTINLTYKVIYHDIDEQDWAESWKKYFYTEKITDKLVVKPSWRDYTPKPDEIILEIDPGMAFGTGTHPTTRMCIKLIEKLIRPCDFFLDVGCGSGILMIAAAKLGAAKMMGIDTDSVAVSVAVQNLLKNKVNPNMFEVKTGNLVSAVTGRFSMATANILSEIIVELLGGMPAVLEKNGIFICSGIIKSKQKMVEKRMAEKGFEVIDIAIEEEWVAIAAKLTCEAV